MPKKKEKSLRELTEIWMTMERKTFQQREKAERFYEQNMMQLIVEDYKNRNEDMVFEKVDYLILSVGTSYEPLILNISLLNPKYVLFLYTRETEYILDKIVEHLQLKSMVYQKRVVDATDPLSVYYEIKQAYLSWERPSKVYIDFTGGTKTMSAAAALAGSLIDVQLVYVGTEKYLPDFRKPEPGSEVLYYIDNPVEIFGDLELEKVFTLIERYNYAGAADKLQYLKENIPDPLNRQQINFVYLLVRIYEKWDALEFGSAYEMMEQLLKELKRDYRMHKNILMMDFQQSLMNQFKLLAQLQKIPEFIAAKEQFHILESKSIMSALTFTMYTNAIRREKQEKYDMATLLLYRLLEMIEQSRLMSYGIYITKPEYGRTDFSKAAECYQNLEKNEQINLLKGKVCEIRKNLFKGMQENYLPHPIALLDGFILLAGLGDPMLAEDGKVGSQLQRIRTMVFLRNNSIFAHGLGPVKKSDYYRFRNFVHEMFEKYCACEKISFAVYKEASIFLNPINSKYYQMIGDREQ